MPSSTSMAGTKIICWSLIITSSRVYLIIKRICNNMRPVAPSYAMAVKKDMRVRSSSHSPQSTMIPNKSWCDLAHLIQMCNVGLHQEKVPVVKIQWNIVGVHSYIQPIVRELVGWEQTTEDWTMSYFGKRITKSTCQIMSLETARRLRTISIQATQYALSSAIIKRDEVGHMV